MIYVWLLIVCAVSFGHISDAQERYDVVINEIMADPSPTVGLPSYEWIEIKNISARPINLQNWRVGDLGNLSGAMPSTVLEPDSILIICSSSANNSMSIYGQTITVTSFPSMDNDGDLIYLRSASGASIHAIRYNLNWYKNDLKKAGGWSLELINTDFPCTAEDNWKSSMDPKGGTPGKENSMANDSMNRQTLKLVNAYLLDSLKLILQFNAPLDSLFADNPNNYIIDQDAQVVTSKPLPPVFDEVLLSLHAPIKVGSIHELTVIAVKNCRESNIDTGYNKIKIGLPIDPLEKEWVLNELMFNPKSGAYDFIECLNNSGKIFDASTLYMASRGFTGTPGTPSRLSEVPRYVFPGEHIVITYNRNNLLENYNVPFKKNVIENNSMISMPDDKGCVVLLNKQGNTTDEVCYDEDWHFKLLQDKEGISLERIDPGGASQSANNWHSASSSAGYSTPTSRNSQYMLPDQAAQPVSIKPDIFSPDNDGRDDFAFINYEFEKAGYSANIIIYDLAGNPVRHLVRNGLAAVKGYWIWDGLDDQFKKLHKGVYVIYGKWFHISGKTVQTKHVVILASRY